MRGCNIPGGFSFLFFFLLLLNRYIFIEIQIPLLSSTFNCQTKCIIVKY